MFIPTLLIFLCARHRTPCSTVALCQVGGRQDGWMRNRWSRVKFVSFYSMVSFLFYFGERWSCQNGVLGKLKVATAEFCVTCRKLQRREGLSASLSCSHLWRTMQADQRAPQPGLCLTVSARLYADVLQSAVTAPHQWSLLVVRSQFP